MKVSIIRHLATQGNTERRYIGTTDQPLIKEAEKDLLPSYPEADLIFVSPMLRARQTAALIYPRQEQIVVEGLREMSFGEFEGKNYQDLKDNPAYQAWIDNGGKTAFPGGEDPEAYKDRVEKTFLEIVKTAEEKAAEKIAVIAHGGTIMSLMDRLSEPHQDYFNWMCENGRGYSAEYEDGKLRNIQTLGE